MSHHDALILTTQNLPGDYAPWGLVERWADSTKLYPDCSYGCVWFYKLARRGGEALGNDWGVCSNPTSHRCGLLTFEHQGCQMAETKRRAAPQTNGE